MLRSVSAIISIAVARLSYSCRQQIVGAQHFLVGVEIELAVALKDSAGFDFLLERVVADRDAEMARFFADQLLLDHLVECRLSQIDALQHGLRVRAVHLLQGLRAAASASRLDLIGKDALSIDVRDGLTWANMADCRIPRRPESPRKPSAIRATERIVIAADCF